MAWCFSTRASVATVLTTHPCVSRCLRVSSYTHILRCSVCCKCRVQTVFKSIEALSYDIWIKKQSFLYDHINYQGIYQFFKTMIDMWYEGCMAIIYGYTSSHYHVRAMRLFKTQLSWNIQVNCISYHLPIHNLQLNLMHNVSIWHWKVLGWYLILTSLHQHVSAWVKCSGTSL